MNSESNRLYKDLAWLWELWGDPEKEYADYCGYLGKALASHARRELKTLLNAGCGGGKNLFTLRKHFQATGLDLSPDMLALAAELNPGCELVRGDLRNYGLDRLFDAIFIDDAVSYLQSREDLRLAFREAYEHLAPGGVLALSVDATCENFQDNRSQVFHSITPPKYPDTRVTYITSDHLRADGLVNNLLIFLIRQGHELRCETDWHVCGLFPLQTWRDLLKETGFEVYEDIYTEDGYQYPTFFCVKS